MMPSLATWLSGQLGMFQTHASCDMVAACAGLPYGLAEAVRLLQEVERPVLVVCGEKFSDKIGTVRTSRMIFSDGAAAAGGRRPPRPAPTPDVEYYQTYASGPMSEVDSIIWPNPEFDNNITIFGREVRALVKRYLAQMIDELRALPHPTGRGTLLDAIDLVVPHQANKAMVVSYAGPPGSRPRGSTSTSRRWGTPHRPAFPSPWRTRCARASSTGPCACSARDSGRVRSVATW